MAPSSTPPPPDLLRIGILGAAGISHKNGEAIKRHGESGCRVTAVASRSLEKAEKLIESIGGGGDGEGIRAFGGPNAYDDLLDQCKGGEVDAVYVPLPTAMHKRYAIKALNLKYHVLIEKPVALCCRDYEEMVDAARRNSRLIMDGTFFVHHPRTAALLRHCGDGGDSIEKIGDVKRIEAAFTFMAEPGFFSNNIRCKPDCDPLGCVGDLAFYCVRMAILVFRAAGGGRCRPVAAKAVDFTCNEHGIPMDTTGIVYFEQDRKIVFHASFTTMSMQRMVIIGEKKTITLDDFVLPTSPLSTGSYRLEALAKTIDESGRRSITRDYRTVTVPMRGGAVGEETEEEKEPLTQQLFMWKNFSRIASDIAATAAASGSDPSSGWTASTPDIAKEAEELLEVSLWNQRILDAIMESIRNDGQRIEIDS